jgi:hypothetical protein
MLMMAPPFPDIFGNPYKMLCACNAVKQGAQQASRRKRMRNIGLLFIR